MILIDDFLKIIFKKYIDGKYDRKNIAAKEFFRLYDYIDQVEYSWGQYINDTENKKHKERLEIKVYVFSSMFVRLANIVKIYDGDLYWQFAMGSSPASWMLSEEQLPTLDKELNKTRSMLGSFIKEHFEMHDFFDV